MRKANISILVPSLSIGFTNLYVLQNLEISKGNYPLNYIELKNIGLGLSLLTQLVAILG